MSQNQPRGDKKYVLPQYRRRAGRSGRCVDGGGGAGESKEINYVQGGKFSSSTARSTTGPGDPSKSLQFGSISPGSMNGMKIRARANSAPQNMDEQTRDQVHHDSLRGAASTSPTPTVYKLQWRKKHVRAVDQSNPIEPHSISKEKRDVHVPAPPSTTQTCKPLGHPVPGISVPMPFHQPEAPVQCGDVKPQMQSQGTANSSTPMPIQIPLRMRNTPLEQQQVFVPGIPPHQMLPQGTTHQDQSLNVLSQIMGPQIAPQLGNMGMSRGPQYQPQRAGKYGGPRKTVKDSANDLSKEFEITSHIAEALIASNVNVSCGSYPSPGRVIDRPARGPRLGHGASCIGEDDKWNELPVSVAKGQDIRLDNGHGGNLQGLRPGLGWNCSVSKDLHEQPTVQYAGGINSEPIQFPGLQRGLRGYKINSGRWHRTPSFHKGTTHSPQFPLQVMHKAERKYEKQTKQRQLNGNLDKLTPQNFGIVLLQIKQLNIDNAYSLYGTTAQIYDKAVAKPAFCEIYAKLCYHLDGALPVFSEDNKRITFKRILLNMCQEEYERGGRGPKEANKAEEGEVTQPELEREEKGMKVHALARKLGNIQFIGELYKVMLVPEKVVHHCIKELLGECQRDSEEDIEALCK